MTIIKKRFQRGIILKADDVGADGITGELKVGLTSQRLQVYLEGQLRTVVTQTQEQTLTNKTIDADSNILTNIETENLKAGVLNTSITLTGASDTQLPSALAVKTYIDNKDSAQNEASEIVFTPVGNIVATNVQTMGQELDSELTAEISRATTAESTLQDNIDAEALARSNADTTLQDNIDALALSSQGSIDAHINDTTGAHAASAISVVPAGNLAATDAQTALTELQTDIDTRATSADLTAHTGATSGVHGVTGSVVGTTDTQTLTNKTLTAPILTGASIESPSRLDAKIDTLANLTTYATTATNGQLCFASDTKEMYQVIDGQLSSVGGAPIVKILTGEDVSVGEVVYVSTGTGNDSARTAGRIYKADASNDDRIEVLGVVKKAALSGAQAEVQTGGNLSGLSGLTAGTVYFLSAVTPGAITNTAPSTNGQWAISIGYAVTATELVINPVPSASATYISDTESSFTISNNQSSAANITSLLIDPLQYRSFYLDYSIYRKTDTALSAVAQMGTLRGIFNTETTTWYLSDDFSGQNSGVTFSMLASGQIQYVSTNITGTNYSGVLKYNVRKTFTI